MRDNQGVPPQAGSGHSAAPEPVVSALRASVPNAAWVYTHGEVPKIRHELIYALGRLGDIYGPLPPAMFRDEGWEGNMLGYSHDLIAYAPCELGWREALPLDQEATRWPR